MKIGIVTIYDLMNYGNRLQNYATEAILRKLNHDVETLILREFTDKDILRLILRRKGAGYNWNWKQESSDYVASLSMLEKRKYYAFKKFSYSFLNIKKITYWKRFSKSVDAQYDFFFAGSDQIWNPFVSQAKDWEFLSFACPCKRNSWAASFGVSDLGSKEGYIKNCLMKMNHISVREKDGAEIVERLTGKKAVVLIDPTMMLSREEWSKISLKPSDFKTNHPYILTYFLGERGKCASSDIDSFSSQFNLDVIHLNEKKNESIFSAGPSEFLWLFEHSSFILTDSFHACVFAFLYNKPFLVYDREGTNKNMNSRLKTLLSTFHIERKYANSGLPNDIWEHDYTEGYKQLEIERKKAFDFLKESLEG